MAAKPLAPGLYLVATPIGHLGDVTLRALAVLANADRIACEDTRHSRRLLDRYGVTGRLTPYHEHNAERERPRLIEDLAKGARIALISDAGTPLISDPGYKLVEAALAADVAVLAVPGASAMLAALCVAGLPTDQFTFAGFLPPKSAARRTRLAELAGLTGTLIIYEAPSRVGASLADMAAVLGPARPAALARELTKLHEEVRHGSLAELAAVIAAGPPVLGECVVVVGGAAPKAEQLSEADIDQALSVALASQSLRDAARQVAQQSGLPRGRLYARALDLAKAAAATGPPRRTAAPAPPNPISPRSLGKHPGEQD